MISQPIEERYRSKNYWTGILQLELFKLLNEYKKEKGLSQNGLAAELGFSKSYLSQVMNGNFDHRLSKLVELALAVGKVPEIRYRDIDTVVREAKGDYEPLRAFVTEPMEVVRQDKKITKYTSIPSDVTVDSPKFETAA